MRALVREVRISEKQLRNSGFSHDEIDAFFKFIDDNKHDLAYILRASVINYFKMTVYNNAMDMEQPEGQVGTGEIKNKVNQQVVSNGIVTRGVDESIEFKQQSKRKLDDEISSKMDDTSSKSVVTVEQKVNNLLSFGDKY